MSSYRIFAKKYEPQCYILFQQNYKYVSNFHDVNLDEVQLNLKVYILSLNMGLYMGIRNATEFISFHYSSNITSNNFKPIHHDVLTNHLPQ